MAVIAPQKFGWTVGGVFLLLGGIGLWKTGGQSTLGWVFVGVGAFLIVSACFRAPWLIPIERVWMKVAHVMGAIMTRVILTLVFVLVLTPLATLRRLFRKQERERETYWQKREGAPDMTRLY